MRFRTEHRFVAAPAEVVAALVDPDFHAGLRLPDLAPVEVLAAGEGWIRLRYEFVGSLDPLARRLLAGRPLRWVQELRASADGGRLTFAAEASPERLHGSAAVVFIAEGPGTTKRVIDGTLAVDVPLIGRSAERRILPGLLRRLDAEAEALRSWLARR